jgi:predicted transcriptional regulator
MAVRFNRVSRRLLNQPQLFGGDRVKVQALMSTPDSSVKADDSLAEIIQLISSHQINHVPVIDDPCIIRWNMVLAHACC